MPGAFGLAAGELLAIELAPGPAWIDVVHRCWDERIPFLPLDVRLTHAERRVLIDLAKPAAVVDAAGDVTMFTPLAPEREDLALVIGTSGTAGAPKLVELLRDAVEMAVQGSVDALGLTPAEPW